MNLGIDPRIVWQQQVSRDTELPRSVRHVALVLATHLGLDLIGGVALTDLIEQSGYERRSVLISLGALRASGWLSVRTAHSPGRVNVYRAESPGMLLRADLSQVHDTAPVERSQVHDTAPVERSQVHDTAPVERSQVHPRAPVERSQVHGGAPLLRRKNYVRTYADLDVEKPRSAEPAAVVAQAAVDEHEKLVDEVLEGLKTTRLRPRGGAQVNRLRGLIRQRAVAGVTAAEIAEDVRTVTTEVLDPPAMFARAVRREPWIEPAAPKRPDWCGECDEGTRQVELEDGRQARCPACHPLSVSS